MEILRNNRSRVFIIGVAVLVMCITRNVHASPLYGGYNGESETWVEVYLLEDTTVAFSVKISVGTDPGLQVSWARVNLSSPFFLPYFYSIEFSYETGDIISASFTSLLPWPVKFGVDTNNLRWVVTNLLVVVGGQDSIDNKWLESGVPGLYLYAVGSDNHGHRWQWVKFLSVLLGWREDLIPDEKVSPNQVIVRYREELESLSTQCVAEGEPFLRSLVGKLSEHKVREDLRELSEGLGMSVAQLPLAAFAIDEREEWFSSPSPSVEKDVELDALLSYIEKEIFTEEVREGMRSFLESYMGDVRTRLEKFTTTATSP